MLDPMFGRRPDATLVRDVGAVRRMMQYISPRRAEAVVYYSQEVAVDAALDWLDALNAERGPDAGRVTLFHLVLWALGRVMHERQKLNRFTAGGKLWQRDGIWLSFSAKKAFADDAPIMTVKRRFDPEAPLTDFVDGLLAPIRAGRAGEISASEKEISLLLRMPGPLLRLVVGAGGLLDRWGLFPRAMIEPDPLFCSAFVANLGSVGLDAGYHHLWEWGTCPVFCAMGRIRQTADGRRMTLKYTYDERIADGFYAGRALERVRAMLEQPGEPTKN